MSNKRKGAKGKAREKKKKRMTNMQRNNAIRFRTGKHRLGKLNTIEDSGVGMKVELINREANN